SARITQEPLPQNTSKFDLSLIIAQDRDGLSGSIEYSSDLFKGRTIDRMMSEFKHLLNVIVSEPSQEIIRLEALGRPIPIDKQPDYRRTLTDKASRHETLVPEAIQPQQGRKTPKEKLIAR